MDNIDWPSKKTLTAGTQRKELIRIFDLAVNLRLNLLILQVRPSADALYRSDLEPWSEFLTGRQGQPPQPDYDPLAFAVEEAHRRGLLLHVWLNPYRAKHPKQTGPLASSHIARTQPSEVKAYGNLLWMNPASEFVQERTLNVVKDLIARYDIDGVHIDDYFYPYPVAGQDFPDQAEYDAYLATGGSLSRGDWRRERVDVFVKKLYDTVKQAKRDVQFGISPFGIYRPGVPPGIKAGIDQYSELYADARKWLREGWCDYYVPQLYWPINQAAQSYPKLLEWWQGENVKKRTLLAGNFTSRTNPREGNWRAEEIANQIAETRRHGADGNVHFSMKAFLNDWNGVTQVVRGRYGQVVLPPPVPWLDDERPARPSLQVESAGHYRWQSGGDEVPMWWVVYRLYGSRWLIDVRPSKVTQYATEIEISAGKLGSFAVAAVDRSGNVSEAATIP